MEDMLYLFHADIFIPDDHIYDRLTLDSKEAKIINDFCKFIVNFADNGYAHFNYLHLPLLL